MKKGLLLLIAIFIFFNTAYLAPPRFRSKKVRTPQELVNWLKNENADVFQDGNYKAFIERIRKNGNVLIADKKTYPKFYQIEISRFGRMFYWRGDKYPNRTQIVISEINMEKEELLAKSIFAYFTNDYNEYDDTIYDDTIYKIKKENAKEVDI